VSFSAIIDNTALVYLTQLDDRRPFIELLKHIFYPLYIPMAVKNEYALGMAKEPNRSWLLDRLNTEQGFYRLCTSYDTFVNILVEKAKGMDKGESESYSQFKKIGAQILISDDKRFVNAVNELDKGIKVYSSLHLICWLDVLGFLPLDWKSTLKRVHGVRPFRSKDLREAYIEIASKTGISLDKKILSEKCSLKKILSTRTAKGK
jgi:hypothetical protein